MSGGRNYSDASFFCSPQKNDWESDFLFLACEMKFCSTNHTVTNTWKLSPTTLCVCVCVCVCVSAIVRLYKRPVMRQPVCSSTHHILQPFIHWASANIDALHVMLLIKKKAPVVDAAALPLPRRCERPLRGSRITRQAPVCSPLPPFKSMLVLRLY